MTTEASDVQFSTVYLVYSTTEAPGYGPRQAFPEFAAAYRWCQDRLKMAMNPPIDGEIPNTSPRFGQWKYLVDDVVNNTSHVCYMEERVVNGALLPGARELWVVFETISAETSKPLAGVERLHFIHDVIVLDVCTSPDIAEFSQFIAWNQRAPRPLPRACNVYIETVPLN
ncbi:MAG: hypothetical protein Q9168_006596 [Polycauliona sp. 1 TL-2023]